MSAPLEALRRHLAQARELLACALDSLDDHEERGAAPTRAEIDEEVLCPVVSACLRDHAAVHDGAGATIGDLETLVGAPRVRVLKALAKLLDAGVVVKRGVRRGTRYHLAELVPLSEEADGLDLESFIAGITEPPPPDLGALVEADSYAEGGA